MVCFGDHHLANGIRRIDQYELAAEKGYADYPLFPALAREAFDKVVTWIFRNTGRTACWPGIDGNRIEVRSSKQRLTHTQRRRIGVADERPRWTNGDGKVLL